MRGQFVRHRHQYYLCNGRRQVVSLCDMPSFRGDWVDAIVWEWAKMIIENPENLRIGLEDAQKELERENQALFERLSIVEEQIAQYQSQLDKLLDLYLEGNFPKEVLTEGNPASKRLLFNLGKEQNDLMGHIRDVTITNDQLNYIESFCAKIRKYLDHADFNTKRQILSFLIYAAKLPSKIDKRFYI